MRLHAPGAARRGAARRSLTHCARGALRRAGSDAVKEDNTPLLPLVVLLAMQCGVAAAQRTLHWLADRYRVYPQPRELRRAAAAAAAAVAAAAAAVVGGALNTRRRRARAQLPGAVVDRRALVQRHRALPALLQRLQETL